MAFLATRCFLTSGLIKVKKYFNRAMSGILHEVDKPLKPATFGMGCFWANDALFGGTHGVYQTIVGYTGGTTESPTYANLGDHTEVVQIHYNPEEITYDKLLELFWTNHEYGITKVVKKQYRSVIFHHDDEQKKTAEETLKTQSTRHKRVVVTVIEEAGVFYPAEDYHQKYRLQKYESIKSAMGLTSELLRTSYAAAKINGFVAGVGEEDEVAKVLETLKIPEHLVELVKTEWRDNAGGGLYC